MRISFDLDHTLILHGTVSRKDSDGKLLGGDILRKGTISLLKELSVSNELWVYTTSFRKQWFVLLGFWLKGIKIARVINENDHRKLIRNYDFDIQPSKYPVHYGIDVHVDDSIGVLQEGDLFGFKVIQVNPDDLNWVETIKQKLHHLS